jgi:hypothetical protein
MKAKILKILNKISIKDTIEDVQFEHTANEISKAVSVKKLDNDDIADISINIVDRLVEIGLIKDCIDTDDDSEFDAQDEIRSTIVNLTD